MTDNPTGTNARVQALIDVPQDRLRQGRRRWSEAKAATDSSNVVDIFEYWAAVCS